MCSIGLWQERLDEFLAALLPSVDIQQVANDTGLSPDGAARLLTIYANEAKVGLGLVVPILKPGLRLLEIGSGIGVLLQFLRSEGVDIVGIEPGASGFGFMPSMQREISRRVENPATCHPIGAEALDQSRHGVFDLVFSTNVLEHVPDLSGAFAGMNRVLAPDGQMVHACPNYRIPYEPHFGIPLVPFFPRLTGRIAPMVHKRYPGLWSELNFITAGDVRRLCVANGLDVRFDRGLLGGALRRLAEDAEFRARQGAVGRFVGAIIGLLRLGLLIERLPGEWATPMVFRAARARRLP